MGSTLIISAPWDSAGVIIARLSIKSSSEGIYLKILISADYVESVVRQVSLRMKQINSKLELSVCGHPELYFMPPNTQGRQGVKWANAGLIDVIYNMDYNPQPDWAKYEAIRQELSKNARVLMLLGNYEKNFYSKQVMPRNADDIALLVKYGLMTSNSYGIYIFSMLNDDQIRVLSEINK